ncbi:unnamed protein product, partial [Hydatigera taeniaeformis]|uniref:Protein kinase domain-containing protein n=1 Tax=Hydatigena taeniaeformis TaxID=6205 RepID=A0A0R3WTN6_HYDTA
MTNSRLSDYLRQGKIGEGTYGVVYKCLDRKSGQLKAMKRIKLENSDQGIPSTALREIALLRELNHPNIVTLEDIVLEAGRLYLIFEYVTVDLRRHMDSKCANTGLPPNLVKSFMYQMLQALQYCHLRRIVHRDLKPQNVLVDVDRSVVKLADFGLARCFSYPLRALTHEVVTQWYRCPEVLLGVTRYCCGVDIWAMGCIFAEMATGDPLFCGDSEIDQLFCIFRMRGLPKKDDWPD